MSSRKSYWNGYWGTLLEDVEGEERAIHLPSLRGRMHIYSLIFLREEIELTDAEGQLHSTLLV